MGDKILALFEAYGPMLISALMILLLGILFTKLVLKLTTKALTKSRLDPTGKTFLVSVIRVTLYIIVSVMALTKLNVPMTSIIAMLSAAGLAVSLAVRENLSNIAGGFILMFSRPFKVGDYIAINGSEGNVDSISIMYTKLLTMDNRSVMIPNATVTNSIITNYTSETARRLEHHYSIAYSADFDRACEVIREILKNDDRALNAPDKPMLVMTAHNDSSVDIMLRVWVLQQNYWGLYYDLMHNVKAGFDASGIEIPFNQLDIHIDNKEGGSEQ